MSNNLADLLLNTTGFEWDEGNQKKNWVKHQVSIKEAEEVFLNDPQVLLQDIGHSQVEERFTILAETDAGRQLAVTFTIRGKRIRVISARDQRKGAERRIYKAVKEAV